MTQEQFWELAKSINDFISPFACFYLGYYARGQGWFQANRHSCPVKGCTFIISGKDNLMVDRLWGSHQMSHERV